MSNWFSPDVGEDRLVRHFVLLSVAIHGVVLIINSLNLIPHVRLDDQEWEIQADLIVDSETGGPDKTQLPDAKEAEEAAVPANMLPQLTKKFQIEEDTVADEGATLDTNAQVSPKVQQSDDRDKLNIRTEKEEANRIKKREALRRLALEKLRKQSNSKQVQAQKENALAKLREELSLRRPKEQQGGDGAGFQIQKYRSMVQSAVRRNYALPEAYNLRNAQLAVVIAIVVNEKGDIISSKIERASGDSVFDELAFKAVKKSSPLPKPPVAQAGEWIHLKFTPKSF